MKDKMLTPARELRLTYFVLGSYFLFNPFITVFDFLPDFIGALFFVLALFKIRDLSDYLESARTNFIRFFWISFSRIPSFILMFWISHSFVAERSIMLVFTFCYAVIESVLLAVCFNSLFDGLIYIGERNEGTAIFKTVPTVKRNGEYEFKAECEIKKETENKKKPKTPLTVGGIKRLSIITFLLLRGLSVLPELVYVADNGDVLSAAQKISPVHFKGVYTVLAFIPAFLLGVIWLVNFVKYMRGICADGQFCANVLASCNAKVPKDSKLHDFRRYSRACVFFGAAAVLALDFFLDDKNSIPDVFASALMLAGVIYFSKRVAKLPPHVIFFSCGAVVADLASQFAFNSFIGNYLYSDVWRVDEATNSYILYIGVDALATLCLVLTAILMLNHSFYHVKGELLFDEAARNSPRIKNEISDVNRKRVTAAVISVISAASNVFYRLSLADTKSVAVTDQRFTDSTHMYIPKIEMYWLIDVVISLLVIAAVFTLIEKTKDGLKYKYMLED